MLEGPDWIAKPVFGRDKPAWENDGFVVRSVYQPFAPLAGKRLFFFSDLHLQHCRIHSLFPFRRWNAFTDVREFLTSSIRALDPDYLVFGGDLISEMGCLEEALYFLRELPQTVCRIAVIGNWEYKVYRRKTVSKWEKLYQDTGFRLLCNRGFELGPLRFYGTDVFRFGKPKFPRRFPDDGKCNILLTHNPDCIPDIPPSLLAQTDMILAGHTHGGQMRLPFLGAVAVPTHVWKRFEYGEYDNRKTGTGLFVSAGLGVSGCNIRVNCPPEAVCVEFTS